MVSAIMSVIEMRLSDGRTLIHCNGHLLRRPTQATPMEESRQSRGSLPVRPTLVIFILVLGACASSAPLSTEPKPVTAIATPDRTPIVVPLSLHVMVEEGAQLSELSSTRTTDELRTVAAAMSDIWAQADVTFSPVNVHQIEVPTQVLQGILLGNTDQFFDQVNVTFVPENSQAINGFYVRSAFGVNGFTPQGSNIFFVVDDPSVPDERVSSHEVGHIFGLHHDTANPGQLMFSGTRGVAMSELEKTVARYGAQGLFPQGIDP